MDKYEEVCFLISELVTSSYSTSFYSASSLFDSEVRPHIFNIYGFVRFADEIVDSFHDFDKAGLLQKFESDLDLAMEQGISLNPVLHSFCETVKKYSIPDQYIRDFLASMKTDLVPRDYKTRDEINRYIYGSADVVGLMCLKVFCRGDEKLFGELETRAMKLGSAFQKVNFLRDLRNDIHQLNRIYFPGLRDKQLDDATKNLLVEEIESDFSAAFTGIRKLPGRSRLAVLTAYYYYLALLRKIKRVSASRIMDTRIRIPNWKKYLLLMKAWFCYRFLPGCG